MKINRVLSIQIRELNAGRNLHEKMMQFKLSVPLMAKLQNDSLRDRHWQHLMNQTGHHFSTDADKFRLSDMFAMNLYKHQVRKLLNTVHFIPSRNRSQSQMDDDECKPIEKAIDHF